MITVKNRDTPWPAYRQKTSIRKWNKPLVRILDTFSVSHNWKRQCTPSHQSLVISALSFLNVRNDEFIPVVKRQNKCHVYSVFLDTIDRGSAYMLMYIYFAVDHNEVRTHWVHGLCLTNPRMTGMPKCSLSDLDLLYSLSVAFNFSTSFPHGACSTRGARTNGTVQASVFHGHQFEQGGELPCLQLSNLVRWKMQ